MAEECFQDIINLTVFSNDAIIQNNRPFRFESGFSVDLCVAATNFLLLGNVARARVESLRKLPRRKKYGRRRRRDEGEKKFSTNKRAGGKVLHSYSGLLNNVTPPRIPSVNSARQQPQIDQAIKKVGMTNSRCIFLFYEQLYSARFIITPLMPMET